MEKEIEMIFQSQGSRMRNEKNLTCKKSQEGRGPSRVKSNDMVEKKELGYKNKRKTVCLKGASPRVALKIKPKEEPVSSRQRSRSEA